MLDPLEKVSLEGASAARWRSGRSAALWGYSPSGERLSQRLERDLAARAQAGDSAASERMVRANVSLVVRIAMQHRSACVEPEDLVQEGMVGLCTAIARFDPARGCRFTTFAVHWIRQRVLLALHHQGRMIRVPTDAQYAARRAAAESERVTTCLGRAPTPEELAPECGISAQRLQAAMRARCARLPDPTAAGMGDGPENDVPDPAAPDPQEALLAAEERSRLHRLLATLPVRDRTVLEGRFGLGRPPAAAADLAAELHLSVAAVRQLQRRALQKLRRRCLQGGQGAS